MHSLKTVVLMVLIGCDLRANHYLTLSYYALVRHPVGRFDENAIIVILITTTTLTAVRLNINQNLFLLFQVDVLW